MAPAIALAFFSAGHICLCDQGAHSVAPRVPRYLSAPSEVFMEIVAIQPLVALIAGVLILIVPRLLNIIVAVYLIVVGLMGLFPNLINFPGAG